MGGIGWEAIRKFYEPQQFAGEMIILVAGAGVVINSLSALMFSSGQRQDLNIKAAFSIWPPMPGYRSAWSQLERPS
jgi:cobalt-zinc-cadmium efflux system protein